jgi:hypothetical protein
MRFIEAYAVGCNLPTVKQMSFSANDKIFENQLLS